ncbi:MAG: DUF3108 domain-containing protein [Deltaproteobacteria bacterium]|nr:DUF3108 domain-containing protein [Deltaproteobacteria bacterium]
MRRDSSRSNNAGLNVRWLVTFVVITAITMFSLSVNIEAGENDFPFNPGEKLTFQLKWMFIPAGEGVLEVLPIETIDGVKAYHFLLTVKSNSFIDHFYKVRDKIDAYTDIEMTHSILYKKKQQEGKTHRDIVVNFDWRNNKAVYSTLKEKRPPIDILPGSFDPLSAFYFVRLFDLEKKSAIERPVTDGKKCIIGKAAVIKRETLKLASGTYDTFLIEPEIEHVGGVFEKSKDAKIQVWVTADHRRIPVKLKSKVVVGSFVGELVSATGLK